MLDCLRVLWTRTREGTDESERVMLRNLEQRRWIELRNCVAVSPLPSTKLPLMPHRARYPRNWFSEHVSSPSTSSATFPTSSSFSSLPSGSALVRHIAHFVFGVSDTVTAHLHHAYDTYVKGGRTAHAAVQAGVTSRTSSPSSLHPALIPWQSSNSHTRPSSAGSHLTSS